MFLNTSTYPMHFSPQYVNQSIKKTILVGKEKQYFQYIIS